MPVSSELLKVVDVESVTFSHKLRGYSIEEVDIFLDRVADTLQQYSEMHKLDQQRIRQLEENMTSNEDLKSSLQNALDMAKRSSDVFLASSQKESEALLIQAKAKAEEILSDSISQKNSIMAEIEELRRTQDSFIAEIKANILRFSMLIENIQEKKK